MIIFWCIVSYGITQIIVESQLFKPVRILVDKFWLTGIFSVLLNCMICTGAWVGFILSYYWISPVGYIHIPFELNGYNMNWFLDGMFASCVIWFMHLIEKLILNISNYLNRVG